MPFCPDCGKEVSEGTRFCPECGRPLAVGEIVVGGAVKGKKKKKIAGIIAVCVVAIIVIIVLLSIKPWERTYTLSVSVNPWQAGYVLPPGDQYKSGDQVTLTAIANTGYTFDHWSGSASDTTSTISITMDSDASLTAHFDAIPTVPEEPEPAIPAHYTTYTDELGLFSISYPPEWEPALEYMEDIEEFSKDIISSITSDIPIEEACFLFMAGLPTEPGYYSPNVNIVVEPLSGTIWTHDVAVTAGIEGLKKVVSDYHEFSQVKTTIDNRTATIIEYQATFAGLGTGHFVQMMFIVNKTFWGVTCTALSPGEYSEWEDDFDAIVRSLRILK